MDLLGLLSSLLRPVSRCLVKTRSETSLALAVVVVVFIAKRIVTLAADNLTYGHTRDILCSIHRYPMLCPCRLPGIIVAVNDIGSCIVKPHQEDVGGLHQTPQDLTVKRHKIIRQAAYRFDQGAGVLLLSRTKVVEMLALLAKVVPQFLDILVSVQIHSPLTHIKGHIIGMDSILINVVAVTESAIL